MVLWLLLVWYYLAEFTRGIGQFSFAFKSVQFHAFGVLEAAGQLAQQFGSSGNALLQLQAEPVLAGFADFGEFKFLKKFSKILKKNLKNLKNFQKFLRGIGAWTDSFRGGAFRGFRCCRSSCFYFRSF